MHAGTASAVQPPMQTILLVEDEESVRQITRHVLESVGYLVLEASSPEQAIDIFRRFEGAINLLLTDVVMPNMSGAQLATRLKEMRPGLATMFMSGYARSTDVCRHFESSDWWIQKPFSTATLLARVAEAISLPAGARESVAEMRLPI